jgi:hypothetical protein
MKKQASNPSSTTTGPTKAEKLLDRFLDKLTPEGDCLIYSGARLKNAKGEDTYGIFTVNGKSVLAHRYAWSEWNQTEIPAGLVVRHLCCNPGCCAGDHIVPGTHKENSADMIAAKHSTKGTKKPVKRFTPEEKADIIKLASSGKSIYSIAKKYKRAIPTISQLLHPKPRKPKAPKPAQALKEKHAKAA